MSERTIPKSWRDRVLTLVYNIVNGLFTLQETGGTVTSDGTEQDVYINNAPSGIYEPRLVRVDLTNSQAGETIILRSYHRIKTGGDLIQDSWELAFTFEGVQTAPALMDVPLQPNRYGVKVTLERTAGVARDYDWEVFYES